MTLTSDRSSSDRPGSGTFAQRPATSYHDKPADDCSILDASHRLGAVTVELAATALPDLVRAGGGVDRTLWSRSDMSILGVGEALRIPLPAGWAEPAHAGFVAEVLGAMRSTDDLCHMGTGPLAIGALPYDPASEGHLSIPRLVIGHRDATAWATLIGPRESTGSQAAASRRIDGELELLRSEPRSEVPPDRFELTAHMPHGDWKQLVLRAVEEMERGSFAKVVLARRVDVVANRPFVLHEALARLASLYPSCAVFRVEGFVGASPETLVRRTGSQALSHPLAGTVAHSGDGTTDDALLAGLMASTKDRREHQFVVEAITMRLRPLCSQLVVPETPSVVALRNVSHLGTPLSGTLLPKDSRLGGPPPTALELAAVLQPTPAVGGYPTAAAMRWQRENEGFERARYAGPVGWVDSRGDGEWALGLRSADIAGCHAALYAGSGIVAGSDAEAELAETQLKLQALLAALVRP